MRGLLTSGCWLAAAAALWLPAATAGTFSISPLRVDLSAQAKTAALKVRNEDPGVVVVQAEARLWSQVDGQEILEPTSDLLVSPPLFTLEPGAEQVLRVALRREVDAERESSYRLVLQEVPQPSSPDFTGLNMVLRLSLPVFVAPAAPAEPDLAWSVRRIADGKLVVRADNAGAAHARVLNFRIGAAQGAADGIKQPVVAYVLPGQYREWTLEDPGHLSGPVWLRGRTDSGEFEAELVVRP
jgi:fimbrial chaperone protein